MGWQVWLLQDIEMACLAASTSIFLSAPRTTDVDNPFYFFG